MKMRMSTNAFIVERRGSNSNQFGFVIGIKVNDAEANLSAPVGWFKTADEAMAAANKVRARLKDEFNALGTPTGQKSSGWIPVDNG